MVIKKKDLLRTERDVSFVGGQSIRFLIKDDGMGFSFHETIIPKGGPYHWHYKKHLESCYCVKGLGLLTNLESGEVHPIEEGTIYVLDHHDNHLFEALKDTVLISVFNPPLNGKETHKEDGSYE